ncbi:hypothetical protein [Bosea sp. TAF32]|uniref:hypothetical protein n=1 Tax=Bosea sp. TAF32 TaxID=3237482 RepID=UPI003F90E9FB
MSATFVIRRAGPEWSLSDGVTEAHHVHPSKEVIKGAVNRWQYGEEPRMRITTQQEYAEAAAEIHRLADVKEGTPQATELAELVAAVQEWEAPASPLAQGDVSTPGSQIPQRPGRAGDERRPGPNPRSTNPTGPLAPFEQGNPDGLAAEKHQEASANETRSLRD